LNTRGSQDLYIKSKIKDRCK